MARRAMLIVSGLLLAACGGGHSVDGGKTTLVYSGVFAGENGTEAGNFTVNVTVEDSSGTGSFRVNGAAKAFTALTYTGTTVVATGGGFSFTGNVSDSFVTGSYTSTTGGGLFTGLRDFGAAPLSFCGTHIGTRNGIPIAGPFTFVQGNGVRRGVFTTVLSEPFRGVLTSPSNVSAVALDTLTGSATVDVVSSSFTGSYAMAAGDTGLSAGVACPSSIGAASGSVFDGVLGGFTGVEKGNLNFDLSSNGLGSTGSYTIGSVTKQFLAVISGVNNEVAAFDSTYRVIASLDTATISGFYSNGQTVAGRVAALHRLGNTPSQAYCGNHSQGVGGAFSFVVRGDSTLFGLYTGGSLASSFQGEVTGRPGDFGALETEAGPVTILPTPGTGGGAGSFGGFWDHTASGGTSGTLTGVTCP
jgi:hypothetical protein